jgi:protein-tyrosine-phosphatase
MKVLVVTETDACCGPMAAAFLNDYSTSMEAVSVGKNPVQSIEPMVVKAMRECLIDLEDYVPKSIEEIDLKDFDVVYECPDLPCPTTMEACRELRDFIKNEAFLFFKKVRAGLRVCPNNSKL